MAIISSGRFYFSDVPNVEDHVNMGLTAGLKLRQIVTNVEYILAIELFAAAQGIDFRKQVIGGDL